MPKITDIKFDIAGTPYVIHVNVNSAGQFSANIPEIVSKALNIESKVYKTALSELENHINSAITRYKNANITQEVYLLIKYGSRGKFNQKRDGTSLFAGYRHKYDIDISFSEIDCIGFRFIVAIKETTDQIDKWYRARKGEHINNDRMDNRNDLIPDKWYKINDDAKIIKWKAVPFSETAYNSLKNAQEKLRSLSEMLFNFIEQDEKLIESTLTNQKLLG